MCLSIENVNVDMTVQRKMRTGIYTYLCKYSPYSYFYMSKLWNACFINIDNRVLV